MFQLSRRWCTAALLMGLIAGASKLAADTICLAPRGADVIAGEVTSVSNYASIDGVDAISFGVTACNLGDAALNFFATNAAHPIVGHNLFRLKTVDGSTRFEQVGQSWVFHEFFALSQEICCRCTPSDGNHLGSGCSSPTTGSSHGTAGALGPKWEVNPVSGTFAFPAANPLPPDLNARRLRVAQGDLEPATNSLYYVEAQYLASDDAAHGYALNNASHRRVTVSGAGEFNVSLSPGQSTMREQPALQAWKANDSHVTLAAVNVPDDGVLIIGARVTPLGDGQWHYEYAVHNFTSDRAVGSISIPLPAKASASNLGFHDVHYYGGDGPGNVNFSGADWPAAVTPVAISWATESFAESPSANALRWGTLYNFRFDSSAPPVIGSMTLGLFKPGAPASVAANVPVPGVPPICPGDVSGQDGVVNVNDLLLVVANWGAVGVNAADVNGDQIVDVNDLLAVVGAWGPCS